MAGAAWELRKGHGRLVRTCKLGCRTACTAPTLWVACCVKRLQQLHSFLCHQAPAAVDSEAWWAALPATQHSLWQQPTDVARPGFQHPMPGAHPPQPPHPVSCTDRMDPQPPNLSFAQPYVTCSKRSRDSAPAHMMHGSQVTYSCALLGSGMSSDETCWLVDLRISCAPVEGCLPCLFRACPQHLVNGVHLCMHGGLRAGAAACGEWKVHGIHISV